MLGLGQLATNDANYLTDVEALAQTFDYAAQFYQGSTFFGLVEWDNTDGFVSDLGVVLGGIDNQNWCGGLPYCLISPNDSDDPLSQYYIGGPGVFGSTGFSEDLRDDSNQVRHFVGGLIGGRTGPVGRAFQYYRETDEVDRRLYVKAHEIADSLDIDTAGSWVLRNLGNEATRKKYGLN